MGVRGMVRNVWSTREGGRGPLVVCGREVDGGRCEAGRGGCGWEGLVRRWALGGRWEGHSGCVNTVRWSADGARLVSGSDDTWVRVWDRGRGRQVASAATGHGSNIFHALFHPLAGDECVVSCSGDGTIRGTMVAGCGGAEGGQAEASGGRPLWTVTDHSDRVKKLAMAPEAVPSEMLSCSEDGTVRRHDLRAGARRC